jgi:ABC-2 type transport system ATP-binding protein
VAEGDPATLGGRAQAPATVNWSENGAPRTAKADDPGAFVVQLSNRYGGTVPGLTVTRPSLEDVYLDLIGSSRT